MTVSIEIHGLDKLLAKLDDARFERGIKVAMDGALDQVRPDLKRYPPPPSGPGRGFVSDRQRRWFFWALRSGLIRVPYVRTRLLGNSWNKRVYSGGGGIIGELRNPTAYGPFVQDRDRQAAIHKGRWSTVQEIADRRRGDVVRFLERAIDKLVQ